MDTQSNLGLRYYIGTKGVSQDYTESAKWLTLAAARGDKDAVKNRDTMVSVMTQQQIAEAQKLARECLARNYKGC